MPTYEQTIAELKARLGQRQQEAQKRSRSLAESGITYSARHRAQNLRLLRADFDSGQEQFATLIGVSSQSQYSSFERGQKQLPAHDARKIEHSLGIPENWLDRDNSDVLYLSEDELSLINQIRKTKPGIASKLSEIIKLLLSQST